MSTSSDQFQMTLSWANPETGQELLHWLATTDSEDISFEIDCLSRDGVSPCTIEVEPLTQKQLEAARIAVEKGYYQSPREACLTDLARHFDISESAVSQRLTVVERKLMVALVEACQ